MCLIFVYIIIINAHLIFVIVFNYINDINIIGINRKYYPSFFKLWEKSQTSFTRAADTCANRYSCVLYNISIDNKVGVDGNFKKITKITTILIKRFFFWIWW